MKINQEQLLNYTPDEAARLLYEAGSGLRGANLKRSSWLLIAKGLHVHRISDILLRRLEAAQTRQDALRVLRIARKWVRTRKGSKSAQSRMPNDNPLLVALETSPEKFQQDEAEIQLDLELEDEAWGHPRADYEEWLIQQGLGLNIRTRIPGLLPLSSLQDQLDRYAWEHHPVERLLPEDLRSHLDEETYQRLLRMVDLKPGLDLSDADQAFLRQYHLNYLLQYVEDPQQPVNDPVIRDGIALVGLGLIEAGIGSKRHPFKVDWAALQNWLNSQLVQVSRSEADRSVTIACAYAFFRDAPVSHLAELILSFPHWQPVWRTLIIYAYQHVSDLLPAAQDFEETENAFWFDPPAYVHDIHWETVLDAGTGSRLVLHNLEHNIEDIFHQPIRLKGRYRRGSLKLMMAGGGTLQRMTYPAFTLFCRPSIILVRLETFTQLTQLAQEVVNLEGQMSLLFRSVVAGWIEYEYRRRAADNLQEGLDEQIAGVLEQHAIAYLMLKECVLRDAFRTAPFRLRRKHIQRFWASYAAGEIACPVPKDFIELNSMFGLDLVREALAHALLDHFKDDWGLPEDAAYLLKESLLTILRSVAITYHLDAPWLPANGGQPTTEDLEHTQEVANFLIQQIEHVPIELAQALMLAPGQGLPLLAGGQVTPLEQNCRGLVREVAGVSQQKVSAGDARVFTCRPLSKVEALDRGNLAGDCSSGSVPMRALSPHHTYYGVFENDKQQRGYMTVYEAWAEFENESGEKKRRPVLCLETINVPIRIFDAVQQDLLVVFEAIAKSRGLADGLVLITGITTWNYQNGEILRQSRRFRQGLPVRLFPADPAIWQVYSVLAPEAQYYTAFFDDASAHHYAGCFRLLAPFDASLDTIEPENQAEAQRIAALPAKKLVVTALGANGPAGFISELPNIV